MISSSWLTSLGSLPNLPPEECNCGNVCITPTVNFVTLSNHQYVGLSLPVQNSQICMANTALMCPGLLHPQTWYCSLTDKGAPSRLSALVEQCPPSWLPHLYSPGWHQDDHRTTQSEYHYFLMSSSLGNIPPNSSSWELNNAPIFLGNDLLVVYEQDKWWRYQIN